MKIIKIIKIMKRTIIFILAAICAVSIMTGCKLTFTPNSATDENGGVIQNNNNNNNNNKGSDKTGKLTKDIFKTIDGGTYHMKMNITIDSVASTMENYVKNGAWATLMEYSGTKIRAVYKDGKSYNIMDDFKMITIMSTESGESQSPGTADTSKLTYVGEGSGEFAGKTYKYDEYKNAEGARLQYFVDGKNLKGIRTTDAQGTATDVEILALDKDVPDSVFDIPSDYTVTEY